MLGLTFSVSYGLFYLASWIAGLYTLIHALWCIGFYFYRSFIRKPHNLPERYGKGSWVVVTGPTSGIGLAYAIEFAKQGFNIVLMGRGKEKLEATEKLVLEANKEVKVQSIEMDFSKSMDADFYEKIFPQLEPLDISVLVNNAGWGIVCFFEKVTPKEHLEQIRLNTGAPTLLTHILIKKLRSRKLRSGIINISSWADQTPLPYTGCYSATKRFFSTFSNGLYHSYRDKIDILNVIPGVVTTKLVKDMDNILSCTTEYCVKSNLSSLGHDFESVPYLGHYFNIMIPHFYFRFLPSLWASLLGSTVRGLALEEFKEKVEAKLKEEELAKKNE